MVVVNRERKGQMTSSRTQPTLENMVPLAKRRGFVFPTSEIYGGLANSYDYGPLEAELLSNIEPTPPTRVNGYNLKLMV